MYVCHCRVVTDGEIREAIDCGARDECALAAYCGAGTGCGGCLPAVRRLLHEAGLPCDETLTAGDLRDELERRGVRTPTPA
ncbi:MAG: (2Fe-2S)-binding protein [Actinobacteria bacterium]|nr:(2Fe-2S)-binding protein [Actinomycetota bacterium]